MLARFCQFKSLSFFMLIYLGGCAKIKPDPVITEHEIISIIPAKWFSTNPHHALWTPQGKPQPHLFFDIKSGLLKGSDLVNVVITTPENSDHAFQLDMSSGQRFYSHTYCPQKDVWNKYSGAIAKPLFSIGFIPGTLDQLGEPQKVIVFGGGDKLIQTLDLSYHQVRLVGAYVEQLCAEGSCLGKDNWLSRMVLIAIHPEDQKSKDISSIEDLKKVISWEKIKAHLENLDGRNSSGGQLQPATKVSDLIPLSEAIPYFSKHSIRLNDNETGKIQRGCHALYDSFWEEVGKKRPEDLPARNAEALNEKIKLKKALKKAKKPVGFASRLKKFTSRFFDEIVTCEKFVYHGNVNLKPEQFWFYTYMGIFFRLHKEGYYFDCRQKTWHKNVLDHRGNPVYSIKKDFQHCSEKDLDRAMEYLPNLLSSIKSNEPTYYKFIDYDTKAHGTHKKLYSWVKVKAKKMDCSYNVNPQIRKETNVFPEDVKWESRDFEDFEKEMKLIY
jgi:inorganic pyrophosphatase